MIRFLLQIFSIIQEEEASFSRTLLKGIERYKKAAAAAKAGEPSRESVSRCALPAAQQKGEQVGSESH